MVLLVAAHFSAQAVVDVRCYLVVSVPGGQPGDPVGGPVVRVSRDEHDAPQADEVPRVALARLQDHAAQHANEGRDLLVVGALIGARVEEAEQRRDVGGQDPPLDRSDDRPSPQRLLAHAEWP